MESPSLSRQVERIWVKLLIGTICGLVVLGFGFGFAKRSYTAWQARRSAASAAAFLSWADYKQATLAARRAIQLDADNVTAARVLAKAAEKLTDRSTIDWWRTVVRLAPDSVEDKINLARAALLFGDITTSEQALNSIAPKAENMAEFHEVAGQLAVSKKNPAAAEQHFARAYQLDPGNKTYQLNVEVFQLQSPSAEERTKAMQSLRAFLEDPKLRLAAARALRDYAVQRRDPPAILDIASVLFGLPEATLADRIFYVHVLHQADHPDFPKRLTELQTEAEQDPTKLYEMLTWMGTEHLDLLALDWMKRLPREIVNKHPVPLAVANSYAQLRDWSGLAAWLQNADWDDYEYLRHAWLARVAREQQRTLDFQGEWSNAQKAARDNGAKVLVLQQLVMQWGWKNEAVEILWTLTKDQQFRNNALDMLYRHYYEQGETSDLYRVIARLMELKPNDSKLRNNFAQVALLMNVDLARANEIANQLHEKEPANPIFASTYAFSLHLKGKTKDALVVMKTLPPEKLIEPSNALYYGVFLAASGDKAEAQRYLEAAKASRLLPEEKALLEKAEASARQG